MRVLNHEKIVRDDSGQMIQGTLLIQGPLDHCIYNFNPHIVGVPFLI